MREPFDFWTQLLPGLVVFGLGLSMTVSPLTAAILAAVDPAQSGIGSAINNAMSRIAGLIAVAFTGVIVSGGEATGVRAQWISRFRRARIVVAALFAVAGLVSWAGIRNDECDYDRRLRRRTRQAVTTARRRRRRTLDGDGLAVLRMQQQLAQLVLDLGDGDEEQLVAALERLVALRHDDP